MSNEVFLIREFERETDFPMIQEWAAGHKRPAPPPAMLPKLGIVAFRGSNQEDVAALWLYMDNSVGVSFLEWAYTKPGISASEAQKALLTIVGFFKQQAASMDYGVMIAHTVPALARTLTKNGFHSTGTGLECLFSLTRETPQ
jgi:hypothetical protein